jgi:hypothetical protein
VLASHNFFYAETVLLRRSRRRGWGNGRGRGLRARPWGSHDEKLFGRTPLETRGSGGDVGRFREASPERS